MSATRTMEAESRRIAAVVELLQSQADRVARGEPADLPHLRGAADFLRIYADRLHHNKEEVYVFPLLAKHGFAGHERGIRQLHADVERARELTRTCDNCITAYRRHKPGAEESLVQVVRELAELYQRRIEKADADLLPLTEQILSDDEKRELNAKFSWMDQAVGLEVVSQMEKFAEGCYLPKLEGGDEPAAAAPERARNSDADIHFIRR